jgi:hypothetical protein
MYATRSSDTSVYNKPTRHHIPEDGIFFCVLLSRHQNVGQYRDIKLANIYFENVIEVKYLERQDRIQIWFRTKLRGEWTLVMLATIRSQNLLCSRLLSKNWKIKIQNYNFAFNDCETLFLTLREEHRLRVFQNRCWEEYSDQRRMKWQEAGPPLWSSGQISKPHMQESGLFSRFYHIFSEVVGLERGPLSLESTTEELLERKSSGFGLEIREYGRKDPSRWPHGTPSICKSWH